MSDSLNPARAYRILGLASSASKDEVKAAYRDLVQVWHPDRFPASPRLRAKAERNLQRINAAYGMLKDREPTAGGGPPPRSGLRESMAALLDLGDVRDSAILDVPARALRRSLVILGLDQGGAPERSRSRAIWLVAGILVVALAAVVVLFRRR